MPIHIDTTLHLGDRIACTDTVIKIGLPTDSGAYPTIIGFSRRTLDCRIVAANNGVQW
jgi:hypothetical protein